MADQLNIVSTSRLIEFLIQRRLRRAPLALYRRVPRRPVVVGAPLMIVLVHSISIPILYSLFSPNTSPWSVSVLSSSTVRGGPVDPSLARHVKSHMGLPYPFYKTL